MTGLLAILTTYPRFVFDFLLIRGFENLYDPDMLSAGLIGVLVVGLVIALVVGTVSPPPPEPQLETDPRAPVVKQAGPTRRAIEGVLRVTILLTGGPLILHALMTLYSGVVAPIDLGTVLDTVNASLAYGAVYLPLHAAAARARHRIVRLSRDPGSKPSFGRPIRVGLGLFELFFPIYFIWSLSHVHDIPFHVILRPALVSAIGTIVAVTGVVAIVLLVLRGNPPVKG